MTLCYKQAAISETLKTRALPGCKKVYLSSQRHQYWPGNRQCDGRSQTSAWTIHKHRERPNISVRRKLGTMTSYAFIEFGGKLGVNVIMWHEQVPVASTPTCQLGCTGLATILVVGHHAMAWGPHIFCCVECVGLLQAWGEEWAGHCGSHSARYCRQAMGSDLRGGSNFSNDPPIQLFTPAPAISSYVGSTQ